MISSTAVAANPFALMMNPQDVIRAVEQSERLEGLNRRVYRPLDRPLIPTKGAGAVAEFDSGIDAADEPAGDGAAAESA